MSSRTYVRATAILTSRSDVRAEPFCSWLKDLVPSMSDVSAAILSSRTDVRATATLWESGGT